MKGIKNYILAMLFLCLIAQAFTTGSLFSQHSNLSDTLKLIAGVFVGISFEAAIFICVLAGSKWAGRIFSVLLFFVGLLFHNDFTDLREIDFWFTKHFVATTLVQVICNTLSVFLSELYVSKQYQEKAEQQKEVSDLNHTLDKMKKEYSQLVSDYERYIISFEILTKEVSDLEIQKSDLSNQVTSLKKQKASNSRGIES